MWFSLPLRERVRVRGIETLGTLTSFFSLQGRGGKKSFALLGEHEIAKPL
jgi:hypothetical protein